MYAANQSALRTSVFFKTINQINANHPNLRKYAA